MPDDNLDIHVRLKGARDAAGDAKHVRREVASLGTASERTGRKARGMGRGFVFARKGIGPLRAGVSGLTGALGFTAGVGLIGAFGKTTEEGREAQKASRSLGAALKSTGAASWITRKQIERQATALSKLAGVDDEVIQKSGIVLLGFTNIRNEAGKGAKVFSRAQKAALNLAAAREAAGKSMTPTDAALQLGKALDDPIKGMTRLSRVGVTFTEKETARVEAMVKAGDVAKAQGVILDKLDKKFAGQARSQADPMKKLGVIFANIAETIGLKLLPHIDKAATAFGKWVTQIEKGTGKGGRFRAKVEEIWREAKPVVMWFGRAARNVGRFVADHPALVKVATALFLTSKALKLLRFGTAISGAGKLIGVFRKLIALKTGATISDEITSSINGGKGKPGVVGRLKSGGIKDKFRTLGRNMGIAMSAGVLLALDKAVNDWLDKHVGPDPAKTFDKLPQGAKPSTAQGTPLGNAPVPGSQDLADTVGGLLPWNWKRAAGPAMTPAMASPAGGGLSSGFAATGTHVHHHYHGPKEVRVGDETIYRANERESRRKGNRK